MLSLFCCIFMFDDPLLMPLQNVKAVFDAAIKVVIKPPQKLKEKKKKPQRGCLLLVSAFLDDLELAFCLMPV